MKQFNYDLLENRKDQLEQECDKNKSRLIHVFNFKNQKNWDSLNHVKLLMAIESKFKIKIAHKFNLALIRMEEAKPTKHVYVPLKDKINMKMIKRKIKLLKLNKQII